MIKNIFNNIKNYKRIIWNKYYPLIKSNYSINGTKLCFITSPKDLVLGGMLRREIDFCIHFLSELEYLKNCIKPGHTVLDIGANIGVVSVFLGKIEPKAHIYSFEPDPFNYSLLNLNLEINHVSNVLTFNYALGIKNEYIQFYRSNTNYGDHRSAKPKSSNLGESNFQKLPYYIQKVNPSDFLNSSLKENAPSDIDIVKIDTQGADFEILEALLPLIKDKCTICIEYSPYHLNSNNTGKDKINILLRNFRHIHKINPIGISPQLESITLENILDYYDQQHSKYNTHMDLVLKK